MKQKPSIEFLATCFLAAFLCLVVNGCNKDKEEDIPPVMQNTFEHNYKGALTVNFTNQMPQFAVMEGMEVNIYKIGSVSIMPGTLMYHGETLVSDDSKIERNGQWTIIPKGFVKKEGSGDLYISVDAGITIDYDETMVYAKDNYGNWVLVSEFAVTGSPNSELGFNFSEAVSGGASLISQDEFGYINWTLTLSVAE